MQFIYKTTNRVKTYTWEEGTTAIGVNALAVAKIAAAARNSFAIVSVKVE